MPAEQDRDGECGALQRQIEELRAQNRRLIRQADALRRRLEESEDEIVRLTRQLRAAAPAASGDEPEPDLRHG